MDQAASPAVDKPAKPRRRWFQFSLRTLLILTTVIAAWVAWWSHTARQQREVVDSLRKVRARIKYDYQVQELKQPRYCPAWLVETLGVDYFASVTVAYFPENARDADAEQVKVLTKLQRLDLIGTQITDTSLEHIKGLADLERLNLISGYVTDRGLQHLERLTQLRELHLSNSRKITDAGLVHLMSLTHLQELVLIGDNVSDGGLEYLRDLHGLQLLNLEGTNVTDAGVQRLQKALPNCKIVH